MIFRPLLANRALRTVVLMMVLWAGTACAQDQPVEVRTDPFSRPPGRSAPQAPPGKPAPCPEGNVVSPFPANPPCTRRAEGLDPRAEAQENRDLRKELPEQPGARLIEVRDAYIVEYLGTERTATGVSTTWTYEVQGHSKCELAATFEEPMVADGWKRRSLETAGPRGEISSIRSTDLYRPPAHAVFGVPSPPDRIVLSVQARSNQRYPTIQGSEEPAPEGFVPCRGDRPPPPPDTPVDREAHLAGNAELFAHLPLPRSVRVVAQNPETGTAMGNGGVAIGFVSSWQLVPSRSVQACALAQEFEAAMASAGWERFSWQTANLRTSWFFDPPQSVEFELAPDATFRILASVNGAIVGTRQYPGDRVKFKAGATPESRDEAVPCAFG